MFALYRTESHLTVQVSHLALTFDKLARHKRPMSSRAFLAETAGNGSAFCPFSRSPGFLNEISEMSGLALAAGIPSPVCDADGNATDVPTGERLGRAQQIDRRFQHTP
jgi:hypothetical protein